MRRRRFCNLLFPLVRDFFDRANRHGGERRVDNSVAGDGSQGLSTKSKKNVTSARYFKETQSLLRPLRKLRIEKISHETCVTVTSFSWRLGAASDSSWSIESPQFLREFSLSFPSCGPWPVRRPAYLNIEPALLRAF